MRKEVFKNGAAVFRAMAVKNGVSEDTKAVMEQLAAIVDEWAADESKDYNIEDLRKQFDELSAKLTAQEEEVANKIVSVRNSIMRELGTPAAGRKTVADYITPEVAMEIVNCFGNDARNRNEVVARITNVLNAHGVPVRKTKNDISGITFQEAVDYAIQFKQDDADELFDMLAQTKFGKFYYVDIDETKPAQIAKQWNKASDAGVTKDLQELAAEGIEIKAASVYKMQRISTEDLADAEEAGQLGEYVSAYTNELRKSVKSVAVKSLLIGDEVNAAGKKVTCFETIGATKTSNARITVVNPEVAATPTIVDFARTAAEVRAEGKKVLVITTAQAIELRKFKYGEGGTETLKSLDEVAAIIGVDKIIVKDYLANVTGLHGIIFIPSLYRVKVKKTNDVAFPEWKENAQYYLYEMYMGGVVYGLQSAAVLREAN